MPANSVIQLRRGTAAAWTSANPVLALAEPGYETDTGKEKRGDGSTAWNSLPYFLPGSGTYAPAGDPKFAATDLAAYVSKGGNDSNDGLAPGRAKLTIAAGVAAVSTGGVVRVGAGTYTETIDLPSFVRVEGAGRGKTTIKLPNSSTRAAVQLASTNSARVGLSQLTIDGNKANQTDSTNTHGVSFDNTAFSGAGYDAHHLVSDIWIINCKADGLHLVGTQSCGEGRYRNVFVDAADHYGIYVSVPDSFFTDCSTGHSGARGIVVSGANNHFSGCKAWWSGQVTPSEGHGWWIQADRNVLAGCDAQDNQAHGFIFFQCKDINAQITSDTNGVANGTGGVTGSGIRADGLSASNIHAVTFDRNSGGSTTQVYGLQLANSTFDNTITLASRNNTSGNLNDNTGGLGNDITVSSFGAGTKQVRSIIRSVGSAPTVAAGSAAGTTPPVPVISGTDMAGTITFGSGASPTGGQAVVVTFANSLGAAPKAVIFTAGNSAAAGLNCYAPTPTSTAFTINTVGVMTASSANTTYKVNYTVVA